MCRKVLGRVWASLGTAPSRRWADLIAWAREEGGGRREEGGGINRDGIVLSITNAWI